MTKKTVESPERSHEEKTPGRARAPKQREHNLQTLRNTIENLEADIAEKNEKVLRLLADFENFRKRGEKETADCIRRERERLLLAFLEVYETLQMACKDSDHEGLHTVLRLFKKVLENEGVTEIDAVNRPFDINLHHAVATAPGEPENTVVEEIKKGYLLDGCVLRPAYVLVAKGDTHGKSNRN
jgi:molecular chaperone GrpE